MHSFSELLLDWFNQYGRKNLPWQHNSTPYSVWVSEIMLQQTQVKTVIPYYLKFIETYPDINSLANSSLDDVLAQWTGLGYYARARNLHKTAQIVQQQYHSKFPEAIEDLLSLPGIGLSTAGAIMSLAMNKYATILDGNCKRVYARCFSLSGYTSSTKVEKKLWDLAATVTPKENFAEFNQAIMDLGSMICSRSNPVCLKQAELCPLSKLCQAFQANTVLLYPQKKPPKKQVEKSAVFIIVQSQDLTQVILEKRPPTGIWGGLWCFPEFLDKQKSQQWLENNYADYSVIKEMQPQQHIFSHFRLNYSVIIVTASLINNISDSDKNSCFSIQESLQLGLPTPIKCLLKSLF